MAEQPNYPKGYQERGGRCCLHCKHYAEEAGYVMGHCTLNPEVKPRVFPHALCDEYYSTLEVQKVPDGG